MELTDYIKSMLALTKGALAMADKSIDSANYTALQAKKEVYESYINIFTHDFEYFGGDPKNV